MRRLLLLAVAAEEDRGQSQRDWNDPEIGAFVPIQTGHDEASELLRTPGRHSAW